MGIRSGMEIVTALIIGLIASPAVIFSVLAACGSPNPDPLDECGPTGQCPPGYTCHTEDHLCVRSSVTDFISVVRGGSVMREAGELPPAGSGPAPTVTSSGTVINGGTIQVTIQSGSAFDRIVIGVTGVDGFYVVTLPAAVVTIDLLITLSQTIADDSFDFVYAVGTGTSVGQYEDVAATVVSVGTGELQVSISWDAESDVDLHVIDPAGDEVYYGQGSVPSGGSLDLDSNAGCAIDHVKNENITWTTAPPGLYRVRVDYFDACSVASTSYVVTVQRKGHAPETFTGTFTGDGDQGGPGSGRDITTFTVP